MCPQSCCGGAATPPCQSSSPGTGISPESWPTFRHSMMITAAKRTLQCGHRSVLVGKNRPVPRAADRSTPASITTILDPTCKTNCLRQMEWTQKQRETAENGFKRVYRTQYAPGCGSKLDSQLGAEEQRVAEASGSGQRAQRRPITAFETTFLEDPPPPPPPAGPGTNSVRRRFGGPRVVQETAVDHYLPEGVQPYDVSALRVRDPLL
jgi:hypothetical protein